MKSVRLGEIEMHVVERGHGAPLLLAHGFPLDHSMWQSQIDELSNEFRVIAPDLRGFGRSQVSTGTVTMEQYADDLASLLNVLRIQEPITFCGLSMGGYIAWQFWRRHAARLKALILCDTRAAADTEEVARGRLLSAQQVVSSGLNTLVESMVPRLFADQTLREKTELVQKTRQVILSSSPEGIAAALRGMAARPDVTADLPRITVPTLVLCGEHDVISRVAEMRDIAAAIPHARFVVIPNAGHLAPLEQPAAVNAAIRKFMRDVERPKK